MFSKKFAKIFFISLLTSLILFLIFLKFTEKEENQISKNKDMKYNSNLIENVEYTTRDGDGNEYFIKALEGEIDFSNPNIIYLTNVYALIILNTNEKVTIVSDFGKYNSENYDTIFTKNVVIDYLDNKITGDYLDFSLEKNSMYISKNVIYTNLDNILKADVVEMNIKTKDTKIFMYEQNKKVNIKSKN